MQVDNIHFFLCSNCKSDNLELSIFDKTQIEVVSGDITCNNCGKKYKISNGIVELILPADEVVKEEKFYLDELNYIIQNDPTYIENNDDFILSLPSPTKELTHRDFVIDYFVKQGQNFYLVLNKVKIGTGEAVLDIGAGKCWTSYEFAKQGCKVFALDIVKEKYLGLKTAEVYINKKNIFFERICADMTNLPFKEKVFDIVFFNSSLHHSYNIDKTVSEAVRVLKDNGKILAVNEPVKGIFRFHKHHKDLKKQGLNENTYFIWEYKKIFSKYNIKFNTFFPTSLNIKFNQWAGNNGNIFYKISGNMYSNVFSKFKDARITKTFLHLLFGMGLNLIGERIK